MQCAVIDLSNVVFGFPYEKIVKGSICVYEACSALRVEQKKKHLDGLTKNTMDESGQPPKRSENFCSSCDRLQMQKKIGAKSAALGSGYQ